MATHRDGFVWVLTAIDRSGRRKKLAERPTRLELRFLRRWWMAWLKKHPREFHSLREHYLTVGEASLFEWAERKPSTKSQPIAPAPNVATGSRTASPPLVRLYLRTVGALSRLIHLCRLIRWSRCRGTRLVSQFPCWTEAGRYGASD